MPETILYAYAILPGGASYELGGIGALPSGDPPDGIRESVWTMIVSSVPAPEYSQESIDRHADDLEWIGAIGVAHQRVNDALAKQGDLIPLRAFTLFSDERAVRRWLLTQGDSLNRIHDRLAGKLEWTLKLEFTGTAWMKNPDLDSLEREIEAAPQGKAYLLRKKLEREVDRSRSEMEDELVRDLAESLRRDSGAETIAETRLSRGGGDPQIDLLHDRRDGDRLERLLEQKRIELAEKQITATVTGPWPPYSFTGRIT